jgi:hypothetical protein
MRLALPLAAALVISLGAVALLVADQAWPVLAIAAVVLIAAVFAVGLAVWHLARP